MVCWQETVKRCLFLGYIITIAKVTEFCNQRTRKLRMRPHFKAKANVYKAEAKNFGLSLVASLVSGMPVHNLLLISWSRMHSISVQICMLWFYCLILILYAVLFSAWVLVVDYVIVFVCDCCMCRQLIKSIITTIIIIIIITIVSPYCMQCIKCGLSLQTE